MTNLILYGITITLLAFSLVKDQKKTKMALKKAWKAFENILPQFIGVIFLVGIMLAILDPITISKLIGGQSGWMGVIISAFVGAITLIPAFVAFPTASLLLQNGAGLMQIAAFVSSLMMVGVVTVPVETQYFGKKLTILRNTMAFLFSFIVALIIGRVVG
ncbi:permease [Alkaliphilus serpentinus]|uniref:Permease n=1 Tax=Alkaliphilus serpentinus TaxID=1482731 RepID=A0A833HQN0_9FIRM|nr:permease [Alkaliphilus serpentinus]KAB3532046.1 permease [Alkaliphilus serpentinus]